MKKTIKTLLKAAVSVGLLIYLFRKMDLREVWQLIQQAHVGYLLAALGVYLSGQVLCAYRWKILAKLMKFHNSFEEFIIYYFAGLFFNLFLPTAIGGDVGRCYYIARGKKKTLRAVISVLADRGTGLAALVLIAGISVYILEGSDIPRPFIWGIIAGNAMLILGLFLPFFVGKWLSRFSEKVNILLAYWNKPLSMFQAIITSFLVHMLIVSSHILIGLSLGLDIPWQFYFFLIPLVVLASMLPVSLNGLGIREGAYVYFLSMVGVSEATAMAFALSWLTIMIISSLLGGLTILTNMVNRENPQSA